MSKKDAAAAVAETEKEPTTFDIGKRDELMDLGFRTEQTVDGFRAHELLGERQVPPPDQEPAGSLALLVALVREEVQRTGVSDSARVGSDQVNGGEPQNGAAAGLVNFESISEIDDTDPDEQQGTLEDDLESDTIEITEEASGQMRLPGQSRTICQELTTAALKYHSVKLERVGLMAKEKEAKDELKIAAAKHGKFFVEDPDNSDSKIYVAAQTADGKNIVVRDQKKFEEKITTEETAAAKD